MQGIRVHSRKSKYMVQYLLLFQPTGLFMKLIDLSGKIFGRLSVIGMSKKIGKNGEIYWRCVCTCGNQKSIGASNMKNGKTQSCGCLRKELASQRAKELFTKPKTKCSVEDCLSDTSKGGHGLCGKHAQRMRRYGDVNYVTPEDKRSRSSRESQIKNITEVKKTTYRKFMGKHQHRVIAEKMLGRQLTEVEHVHHKDGNKHNNEESNLQVMTASEHQKLHAKERMAKNATP